MSPAGEPFWTKLEHNGPLFPQSYVPLPSHVNFYYNNDIITLSRTTEEYAVLYAKLLNRRYAKNNDRFNKNFFHDWRMIMTSDERETIQEFSKCSFREIHNFYVKSKRSTSVYSDINVIRKHRICTIDGHIRRLSNYKIPPPAIILPGKNQVEQAGKIRRRISPEEIVINCHDNVPAPPPGHKWKEIVHDSSVAWIASWQSIYREEDQNYVIPRQIVIRRDYMLSMYEDARHLDRIVTGATNKLKKRYKKLLKTKTTVAQKQIAVIMCLMDKCYHMMLSGSTGRTGLCALRVRDLTLYESDASGKQKKYVKVSTLGNYHPETITLRKRAFKYLRAFTDNKLPKDFVFDYVDTKLINIELKKVSKNLNVHSFAIYKATLTFQKQLYALTDSKALVEQKMHAYVDSFSRIPLIWDGITISANNSIQIRHLKNLRYLDPRVSFAWCKKFHVPLDCIFSETFVEKFTFVFRLTSTDFAYK